MKKIVLSILFVLALCGSSNAEEEIPKWFAELPKSETMLYARGTAVSSDMQLSIDKASIAAKRNLADKLESIISSKTQLFVKEAGIEEDTQIRLTGEGEHGTNGGPPGDLYVVFRIKDHEYFVRDGINIRCRLPINITQASLGATLSVPTLGGNEDIDIPSGTQSGQIFRLRGKGVAQLRGSRRGDQLVTIDVRIPGKLSTEQRDLLEQLSQILPEVEEEEGIFSKFKNAFGA